jgi:hypothetical protein
MAFHWTCQIRCKQLGGNRLPLQPGKRKTRNDVEAPGDCPTVAPSDRLRKLMQGCQKFRGAVVGDRRVPQ